MIQVAYPISPWVGSYTSQSLDKNSFSSKAGRWISGKKIVDFLQNSLCLLKLSFLASLLLNFSAICAHMTSKFINKSAQRISILANKASFARSLVLGIAIIATITTIALVILQYSPITIGVSAACAVVSLVAYVFYPNSKPVFDVYHGKKIHAHLDATHRFDQPHGIILELDSKEGANRKDYERIKKALSGDSQFNLHFDDENVRITFYHSQCEIKSILASKGFGEDYYYFSDNIDRGERTRSKLKHAPGNHSSYVQKLNTFIGLAQRSFLGNYSKVEIAEKDRQPSFPIDQFLEKYRGILIGEEHKDKAPKDWLIKNMQSLKDAGVTTLFMEFFNYDSTQAWLDEYHRTGVMPLHLREYLHNIDKSLGIFNSEANFTSLLESTQKARIRVVGSDITLTMGSQQFPQRTQGHNYVAAKVIEDEMQRNRGKFIALMGSGHAAQCSTGKGCPGLDQLLECPSVFIYSASYQYQAGIQYNVVDISRELPFVSAFMRR